MLNRICEVLHKSYTEWFLPKCKDINGGKQVQVVSAVIREKITAEKSKRFKVILISAGTKYSTLCSIKDFNKSCDGHAEALCYEMMVLYFIKLIQSKDFKILFLTEKGYQLNPEYKFHLFVSWPPCGFMTTPSKELISWKTPFEGTPHILECSSKILINSYFGIQGPLICLFSKPVYISELLLLNYDVKNAQNGFEKAEKLFSAIDSKHLEQSLFSFHPPNFVTLEYPNLLPDCTGIKRYAAQEEDSIGTTMLTNPDDDVNAEFHIRVYKKNKEVKIEQQTVEKILAVTEQFWLNKRFKVSCCIEFDKIHKTIFNNMSLKGLSALQLKLFNDYETTEKNLKKATSDLSSKLEALCTVKDYNQYKKDKAEVTKAWSDFQLHSNQKQHDLKMIDDLKELMKRINNDSKETSIPLCCSWERYRKFMELLRKKSQDLF